MSTPTYAARERAHLTPAELLADSRVMAVRQLRKVLRRPMYVVFAFVQPVIFLLMFRHVFGGDQHRQRRLRRLPAAGDHGADCDFRRPDHGHGAHRGLRGRRRGPLPVAPDGAVGGPRWPHPADLVVNALTLVVLLLVGLAVGFRPSQPVYELLLAFALVLGFAYVFSWVSAFVGVTVRDPETVQSAAFLWVLPLTFVSSAFVPTAAMPEAVRAFADINPVTVAIDAARGLTIGHGDALSPALWTLAWLGGLLLVFVPLALRAFRRA